LEGEDERDNVLAEEKRSGIEFKERRERHGHINTAITMLVLFLTIKTD